MALKSVTAIRSDQMRLAYAIVSLVLAIFFSRLWQLQIVRGESYRQRSEHNRLREIAVEPPRGIIYDRHGEVLARNRPSFNIEVILDDVANTKLLLDQLQTVTGITREELELRLADKTKRRRFEPRVVVRDASRDLIAKIAAHRFSLPGVIVQVRPARDYVFGKVAAHALGYIREISKDQLLEPRFAQYRVGELVGQFGIEAAAESHLRGQAGAKVITVNASGARVGEATASAPKAGGSLSLTLDRRTQVAADEALYGKHGSIVALDATNGDVLALASSPVFDPARFAVPLTRSDWQALVGGQDRPLQNRAVQGAYPPGSIFKMFTALAALEASATDASQRVYCPGFYYFGGRSFRCHKHQGHGSVNLHEALVLSCDVYFYTMGQRIGVDRIHDVATRFGLGRLSNLGIGDERSGLIPSTKWKAKNYRDPAQKKWHPGETLSVAIGQGAVTVTPLQMARAIAGLVNGGKLVAPRILGQAEESIPIKVSQRHLALVKNGMIGVVNDPQGTGKRARLVDPMIVVGGKTGTAQVVALDRRGVSKKNEDHAWFVGFAPAEKPSIVVVALVENGGGGGLNAAPLVKSVMEAYFRLPPWRGDP